jgi:hypothetical protein
MPSDSSAIDNALVAKLGADPALLALCPNGAYWDEAAANATAFVVVSLVDELDVDEFGRTAYEDALYAVEVRFKASVTNAQAAAARVQALLHDQPLVVAGYTWMTMHRESRIRVTEVDAVDPSIRWYRRGGNYRLQMSVN